jgi:SRSO17 transposase
LANDNKFDPARWGLPKEAVNDLAERLRRVWQRFSVCFKTKTHDRSHMAWWYLLGVLLMDMRRNFVNIAQQVIDPQDDGQAIQQFMSDSPWEAATVFKQIQSEVSQRPELSGGMLTLDESGDERAGDQSAGAGRQYIGRLGKVEMGQVGVAIGYHKYNAPGGTAVSTWVLVDAELYMPKPWFNEAHKELRKRLRVPKDRQFATKPQIGLQLIRRAKANGLPFRVVGCDSVYGRDDQFRADLDAEQVLYIGETPSNTQVYLQPPSIDIPDTPPDHVGRPFSLPTVTNSVEPVVVRDLVTRPEWTLHPIEVRQTERGLLTYDCTARRVWTITSNQMVREEWLFIRRESDGQYSFSFSNAPADTSLQQLAQWRSERYFVERTFQDAKSEAGWDELVARKYSAWMHNTALDALALWFIAETKLDWARDHPCDPKLANELKVVVLPALSMANVRKMLKAVMPLKQLSPEQATNAVVTHLVHRAQSTSSRLKKQRDQLASNGGT